LQTGHSLCGLSLIGDFGDIKALFSGFAEADLAAWNDAGDATFINQLRWAAWGIQQNRKLVKATDGTA
jgi:hypothetical protein